MPSAVGVERSVARPERRRRVVDGELGTRHEVRPVVAAVGRKGSLDISDDAVHALDLAGGVVAMRRAEDERRPEGLVQANALVKRLSRSETSTSGSPTSRSTVPRRSFSSGGLERGDQPHPPSDRRSMCTCKKSLPGRAAGSSMKSKADASSRQASGDLDGRDKQCLVQEVRARPRHRAGWRHVPWQWSGTWSRRTQG